MTEEEVPVPEALIASGLVRSRTGQPLVVEITCHATWYSGRSVSFAGSSGPDGRFRVSCEKEGLYRVEVTAPGHLDASLDDVPVLVTPAGIATPELDVVLEPRGPQGR